jgi:hypothetical protein
MNWPPLKRLSGVASETLTPNSYGRWALPLPMHSTSGACSEIDLASALMLALLAHPAGEHQRMGKGALQFSLALDLAHDVANDPAEIGSDRLQRPVGALELLGVRAWEGCACPSSAPNGPRKQQSGVRKQTGGRHRRHIGRERAAAPTIGAGTPRSRTGCRGKRCRPTR